MATHAQGAYTRILFEPGPSPHVFDASSRAMEYLSSSVQERGRIIGGSGIRGVLSDASERAREGPSYYSGSISAYFSPRDAHDFFSTVAGGGIDLFGFTETTPGVFDPDEEGPDTFGMMVDTDTEVMVFEDCKVDHFILRSRAVGFGEQGDPDLVYLQMGIVCSNLLRDQDWPDTPPALGTAAAFAPYQFADSSGDTGITINGVERAVQEFLLRLDYRLRVKYANALRPHSMRSRGRVVQARFRLPWNTDNDDLLGLAPTGVAVSLKLEQLAGVYSSKFTMAAFQSPKESPIIPGKDEVSLIVSGVARSLGTTKELRLQNDDTP